MGHTGGGGQNNNNNKTFDRGWGRKPHSIRFQTKRVGPPRTCSQLAKDRVERRQWAEPKRRQREGRRGDKNEDSKWVLRPPKREPSLEGLLRLAGQSRSPPGHLPPPPLSLGERVQGWLSVGGEVMINSPLSLLEPAAHRAVVEGDCAG